MVKINECIFLIEDGDLLEKYNTIWDKVSADTKKEFNSKPIYNQKYLKTKINNLMVMRLQIFKIKKSLMQVHNHN